MLWLGLHLPDFPLEVFSRSRLLTEPLIVSDGQSRRARVMAANAMATDAGIRMGSQVKSAYALSPEVRVWVRDALREQQALEGLAAWACQYSSMVSLEPPNELLLEIGSSLKLFHGLQALLEKIQPGLNALGYHACCAVAPTPLAALWLARVGRFVCIEDKAGLISGLSHLPLTITGLNEAQVKSCQSMGLRVLGDVLRLPKGGLNLRVGRQWVTRLQQALAQQPDPRQAFEMPLRYQNSLMLPGISTSTQSLIFSGRRLLEELVGLLRASQRGVQTLCWQLLHVDGEITQFSQAMLRPGRDMARLQLLLQESLERLQIPSDVAEISLVVDDMPLLDAVDDDLFVVDACRQDQCSDFIERLNGRLGEEVVQGVSLVMEHRPEYAWQGRRDFFSEKKVPKTAPVFTSSGRPLWLLREPVLLRMNAGRPELGGRLELVSDCERIETGWWDEGDVQRDYFVARNRLGECFWVFRCRGSEGAWFMQGVFA